MIRRVLLIWFVFIASLTAIAQPYGNEWINYSQPYYKFKVAQDGIYRIDSTTLAQVGFPAIDPRNFQLFGRGKELPIYIEGEQDGIFNSSDFIEFYGQRNDGYLDSILYAGSNNQPNPYYSGFTDTTTYFLTYNNSIVNKRSVVVNSSNYTVYAPVNYVWKKDLNYYKDAFYDDEGSGIISPYWTKAEGYFTGAYGENTTFVQNVSLPQIYTLGPPAYFDAIVMGQSNNDCNVKLSYKNTSGSMVTFIDTAYYGYSLNKYSSYIPSSDINTNTNFNVDFLLKTSIGNRSAVSYASLKYPHTLNFENKSSFQFSLEDNTLGDTSMIAISNFNGSTSPILYDITNGKRITVIENSGIYYVLIPNAGSEKECYLTSPVNISNINNIQKVSSSGYFTNFLSALHDSAFIIISNKKIWNEAQQYQAYRSMSKRDWKDVMLIDVDELYDQFANGIYLHPLSIRKFAEYAYANFIEKPQYLLLLGKSVTPWRARINYVGISSSIPLVPTFGNPGADNLFITGLDLPIGASYKQYIKIGRVAARNSAEAQIYLDKLVEFEGNTAPQPWMKNILHFAGGKDLPEQQILSNYLSKYEMIIEDSSFGGNVLAFAKSSTAPIQINKSDSVKKLIDGGVSMLTFFGHGSGTAFDQSIDNPSAYDNKGKYPLLLALSCLAGDIHTEVYSTSETFNLIKDKGTIGFIGSISLESAKQLDYYSTPFHTNLSRKTYGKSLGEIIKNTIDDIYNNLGFGGENISLNMTYHGDPAVILNSFDKPDYEITPADIVGKVESGNIKLTISVTNNGKAIKKDFGVEIIQDLPDGSQKKYFNFYPSPLYRGNYSYTIPIDFSSMIGINNFTVKVNLPNLSNTVSLIPEITTLNNTAQNMVDVLGAAIKCVWPYEYAVIPNNNIKLKISTSNPLEQSRDYTFEICTDDSFKVSNPSYRTGTVNSAGGVVEWNVPFSLVDSTVYYWRVSPGIIDGKIFYAQSSFEYIASKKGWGQSDFFQFTKGDKYRYINTDRVAKQFNFVDNLKKIECQVYPYFGWWDPTSSPAYLTKYKIDLTEQHRESCVQPDGIVIAYFDIVSGDPVLIQSMDQYNSKSCNQDPANFFKLPFFDFYMHDSIHRQYVADFIDTVIPTGSRVLIYNTGNHYAKSWEPSVRAAFQSLGGCQFLTMKDSVGYILWGVKGGAACSAKETIADSAYGNILFTDTFSTAWKDGDITSEIIGPASDWGSLHWNFHSLDAASGDSIIIGVVGITVAGEESLLVTFDRDSIDVFGLSNYIDATTHPYMKLVAFVKDETFRTAPQLDSWRVLYTPIPEGAIEPKLGYSISSSSLQEGDNIKFSIAFKNVSDYNFTDSLLVRYSIEDKNRVKTTVLEKLKSPALSPDQYFIDTANINTRGYAGSNVLWVEVNPIGATKSQLEQYHFNNILRTDFAVQADKINPLLDVTFDGVRIMNGDVVSAKPSILIKLKDENKFIALDDPEDFKIFITDPSNNEVLIPSTSVSFTEAKLPNNSCSINYDPQFLQDGIYHLRVQATDVSKNESGAFDYEVDFEVINKSTITEVMNYPNPFSTSTRFVFKLTGSEVPTEFKIQIMTITGKVVREISKEEIGLIHIGRNITEYAWDGKDQYGDQLANGIYLYRVITKINGEKIEKKETNADQYFTKGFGKMYLMR